MPTCKNKRPEVLYPIPPAINSWSQIFKKSTCGGHFKFQKKSPAHFQMVGNVIVKCELFLSLIFQFLCPAKIMKFIHGGHFEFQ